MITAPWWDEEAHQKPSSLGQTTKTSPLVLVENSSKGTRIKALGPDALRDGLWVDMKLADARSMMPDLQVAQHNPAVDRHALEGLAQWMLRYSPAVSIHGDNGLLMDTTGCDHLFGGEIMLVEDVRKRLKQIGFSSRVTISNTVGASIALVTHGREETYVLSHGSAEGALDALPVDALRLDESTIILLRRLGLKTIGDVRPLPRSALEKRFRVISKNKRTATPLSFAKGVQWRLDQLSGAVREPLTYIEEPRPFRATLACPDLALELEAVSLALDQLLPKVCAMLDKAGKGARGFRLTGYRADGGSSFSQVYVSQPGNDISAIKRLFRDRLDRIDCGYGVDLFVLQAMDIETIYAAQNGMMGVEDSHNTASSIVAFADIVNHKTNILSVMKFAPRTSHVPERAQRAIAVTSSVDWEQDCPVWAPRPLRLLTRPETAEVTAELPDSPPAQFVWRKVVRRIVRSRGPERILPEWWKDEITKPGSAGIRDYYDVEDSKGLRYWIFRSIKEHAIEVDEGLPDQVATEEQTEVKVRTIQWFVHGLF